MKILVTGGAGFIGSCLIRRLLNDDPTNNIVVIDNYSTGKNNIPGAVYIQADISDYNFESLQLNNYDQIYHFAAIVGVRKVLEDPLKCLEVNLEGTKRLLDVLKTLSKKPKLFIASTSEVYGKNEKRAFSEGDDCVLGNPLKARWSYAASKIMDEMICNQYSKLYDIPIVIGRFFSIVGPSQKSAYGMVIPNFVERALFDQPIIVHGDGSQVRSFLHVDDCIDIVLKLMTKEVDGVINIGSPSPIMIKELAYRIKSLTNSKSEIKYVPYNEIFGEEFEDMVWRCPNITKLKRTLGEDIQFKDLDTILTDTIEYYRNKDENLCDN
jgi:UDP-glucose 4-epimerase